MIQQAIYIVDSGSAAHPARTFQCTWNCRTLPTIGDNTPYSVVDLVVKVANHGIHPSGAEVVEHVFRDSSPKLCGLFETIINSGLNLGDFAVSVTILLPSFDGYPMQENIIQDRFIDSESISTVYRFADWNGKTSAALLEASTHDKLASFVNSGAAALIGHKVQASKEPQDREKIDNEVRCRLQLQWWQSELPPIRTLALILPGGSWRLYGPIYNTAKANLIKLVIVDEWDHWLNEPCNSNLREHFLPLSLDKSDGKFTERLVELIQNCGLTIDGLIAWNDHYIIQVAEAAVALGLPTSPPFSYALCRDKHAAHSLRTKGLLSTLVKTEEEASALVKDSTIQFPVVVKPQFGSRSEGVTKITEASQLMPAIITILSELHDYAVIESFIAGPEIDANLVICEGRLLFCEIADNLPCEGDDAMVDSTTSIVRPGNFAEMGANSPSGLPEDELSMARESAFQAVIAAGFKTGVFHVEGRVMYSKLQYERVDGKLDLRPTSEACQQEAKFGLIEINARPPGLALTTMSKRNYGVNYHEHWMLSALQDYEKMVALARPFAFPGLQGAQYWSQTLFPLVVRGGVFDGDAWTSMVASHPNAFEHMCVFDSMWVDGDQMPDPSTGRARALASFIMYARESRQHLLDVVEDIQQQLGPSLATGLIRT